MPHARAIGQTTAAAATAATSSSSPTTTATTIATSSPTPASTSSSSSSPTLLQTSSIKDDYLNDPSKLLRDFVVELQQANRDTDHNSHSDCREMGFEMLNLKLCLYGGKEAIVERSFSKLTTLDEIQQEMRKIFNVNSDLETKLWINGLVHSFKPNKETANNSIDSKENNSLNNTNNYNNNNDKPITTNNNVVIKSSPIKPPPTPPPVPKSSTSGTSSQTNSNSTSPSVITRQAANRQTPIALPDSTSFAPSSPNSRSSILSTSPNSSSNSIGNKDNASNDASSRTLGEVGITDLGVVTLEAINSDGTWPSCKPRYGSVTTRSSKAQPGLCGLSNMGNTCFMNAALQCLSNTPPLTDYILTDKFIDDVNTDNPLGMHGEIARTYADLIKVMWSGNNSSFLPREFKCAVSRFAPQFTGFAQQDCQELMAFLLDGLHEDLNRIKNKPYIEIKTDGERRPDEDVAKESWENYKKRNDSIVVDTFHAMLKSTLVCPECQLVSVTFDPFCYLSLPLPVKREKQVNLTFIPAPGKLDESQIETALKTLDADDVKAILQFGGRISSFDRSVEGHGGYLDYDYCPKNCKISVPRSGPASELCEIAARIFNEERAKDLPRVRQENLVVAEFSVGRITKIYESNEHYNQISDDVVVVEKASNYVLPLYLREEKSTSDSGHGMSKLLFLHVPDLKYTTLYKSIITSLSNLTTVSEEEIRSWFRMNPPTEIDDRMDCDDDNVGNEDLNIGDGDEMQECSNDVKTNGNGANSKPNLKTIAFDLSTVNSFGSYSFETLKPNGKDCDYSSKLYLGAAFSPDTASSPQFAHNCVRRYEPVDIFTPRVIPKPTLQLKDCITQFTNAERLGADDPWYCPKCKKHQQAIKKFDVWSLPKVLIIHLKRFSFSRSWRDKIDTLVEFPIEGLDMSSYVHNPEQKTKPQKYNLIGVANHFGGLGGGHYTAYAKNALQNAWYSFDDALVTPTSASSVVTRSAYVLFYQLQEDSQ